MTVVRFFKRTGRGLAGAASILAAIVLTTVPRPADAGGGWGGGGISPGAAVGLGLGAFGAREPLLLQPVLFPVRLLPAGPSLLSPSGVLSASTELLEPLLPILLRLLSIGRSTCGKSAPRRR